MKKLLLVLLIIIFAAALTVSCDGGNADTNTGGKSDDNAEKSGSDAETEEPSQNEDIISYLPDENYNGYEFNILIRDQYRTRQDFIYEDESEVLDDALYRRQRAVEDRFGVNITLIETATNGENAVTSIKAGDDDYDLILPHAHVAWNSYIIPGLALDWSKLSYVDLDKPWWNQDARKSLSVAGKIFTVTGDASYMSLGFAMAIAFNKNLFSDLGLREPYQMVLDGTWTFDEFSKFVREGSKDLNGDGSLNIADDRLGFVTTIWQAPVAFLYTCGARTTLKDENDIPYIALNNPKTITFLGELFDLLKSGDCHVYPESETSAGATPHLAPFEEEKALLIDLQIWSLKELRGMENSYGVVPYPKYTESDVYTSSVDAGVHTMIIPHTAKDPERTSVILEALSAEGNRIVMPAFYEKSLQIKYTRDDISVQMLDIIKDTRVFDFGYYSNYNSNIGMASYQMFKQPSYDFASYYEKNITAAQRALDNYIDKMLNAEN